MRRKLSVERVFLTAAVAALAACTGGNGNGEEDDGGGGNTTAFTMVSDEFGAEELGSHWRYVDPVGDVTMELTGTNLELTVPSGVSHDLWGGELNQAPRILQPAPNADFGIEIKVESEVQNGFQMQGIVIQESDERLLRLGCYSSGENISVFAGLVEGSDGSGILDEAVDETPIWLRVERKGDLWSYSTAGADMEFTLRAEFEQPLAVSEAGFYAGNAGSNPAFTGSLDYFADLADPIEDGDGEIIMPPMPGPPDIAVWYGDEQDFGPGLGQPLINVLGKITDEDGVVGAEYTLNGGEVTPLGLGPDDLRLVNEGDFNVELEVAVLQPGANTIEITAEDGAGEITVKTITVNYDDSAGPAKGPVSVDWSTVNAITDVGQVVDGLWELTEDGPRAVEPGYDRLITIGDYTWDPHMEVEISFKIHDYACCDTPAVGFAFGWQGHTGDEVPKAEWPLEALTWVRDLPWDPHHRIITYPETIQDAAPRPDIVFDTWYKLKSRSEPASGGMSLVRSKMWQADQSEPSSWALSATVPERSGSLLLVAYLLDVTIGNVTITPL